MAKRFSQNVTKYLEQRAQAAPEAGLQHAVCPQMV